MMKGNVLLNEAWEAAQSHFNTEKLNPFLIHRY